MRTVLGVVAGLVVLSGCGSATPSPQVPSSAPDQVASTVQQSTVTEFALPAGVKELTPVVRQDSPDVYRLAFKGMKPGTLYVWIECDGEGSTPVVVGKVATFTTECGSPGLTGTTIEQAAGLPAFDVAVAKGLSVRGVKILVGRRP